MNIPDQYNLLATVEQVDEKIASIASQIIDDFSERSPLFVALLHGAAPFASKLMFEITRQRQDYHPDQTTMIVSTYGDGQRVGEPRIVTDLPPSAIVSDKNVVIIDDVLDKGVTANFVMQHMRNRGASVIKLAVLCDKQAERRHDITADYSGFSFEDNWLVGMGMDDTAAGKEGYRWLDEIWEVKR